MYPSRKENESFSASLFNAVENKMKSNHLLVVGIASNKINVSKERPKK